MKLLDPKLVRLENAVADARSALAAAHDTFATAADKELAETVLHEAEAELADYQAKRTP